MGNPTRVIISNATETIRRLNHNEQRTLYLSEGCHNNPTRLAIPEPFSCKIGGEDVNAVNARDLHAALGVGRDFSNWIKDQITRARLVEHRDFEKLAQIGEQCFQGVTSRIDYALSLDAAKHVSMMAGTDKGFEVRDYFIKCEKKLSHVINTYLNMSKEAVAAGEMTINAAYNQTVKPREEAPTAPDTSFPWSS